MIGMTSGRWSSIKYVVTSSVEPWRLSFEVLAMNFAMGRQDHGFNQCFPSTGTAIHWLHGLPRSEGSLDSHTGGRTARISPRQREAASALASCRPSDLTDGGQSGLFRCSIRVPGPHSQDPGRPGSSSGTEGFPEQITLLMGGSLAINLP